MNDYKKKIGTEIMPAKSIKCLVADDEFVLRRGVIGILDDNFIGFEYDHAGSVSEILSKVKNNTYDLLILDFIFADGNILKQIALIKKICPEAKIVLLTSSISYFDFFISKEYLHAIISKKSKESRVVECIKYLFYNYENIYLGLNQDFLSKVRLLSEREFSVATLMMNGLGNKEIVAKMNIKAATVSTFRKRIYHKLGISNYLEFVNFFSQSIL